MKMSATENWNDYPALREQDDLPMLRGPQSDPAAAAYSAWTNWASQRQIRDLAISPDVGSLWLATGGGVLRWYPRSRHYTRFHSEHGLPGNAVSAVAVDGTGRGWAAPDAGGLYSLAPDRDEWHPHTATEFRSSAIGCLTLDHRGHLWVGTDQGVYALDRRGDIAGRLSLGATEPPRAIAVADGGRVWACYARGLFELPADGDRKPRDKRPTLLTLAHQDNGLWIGKADGLVRLDLETDKPFQHELWPRGQVAALLPIMGGVLAVCDGQLGWASVTGWELIGERLGSGHVTHMGIGDDPENPDTKVIWIATYENLLKVNVAGRDISPLVTEAVPDVIPVHGSDDRCVPLSNMIQALTLQRYQDRLLLWIGTPRGLYRLDLESFTEIGALGAWAFYEIGSIGDVQALCCSPDGGDVWIGGWEAPICVLKASGALEEIAPPPAPLLALCEGLGNSRWAVTLNGLYRSSGATWTPVLPADRLPFVGSLRSIAQTRQNRMWLGTSAGLLAYDPEGDRILSRSRSFDRCVNALAYDRRRGVLWAGTDEGLFELAPEGDDWETRGVFTAQNRGMAANRVTDLALSDTQAGDTDLWIGTSDGLTRYRIE
jgi:hypothetical protein